MDRQEIVKPRLIPLKIAKKVFLSLAIIFVFDFFLFPAPVLASNDFNDKNFANPSSELSDTTAIIPLNNTNPNSELLDITMNTPVIKNSLPANNEIDVVRSRNVSITAYNSEVYQTDDTPCITANGFNLCKHSIEDSIAANFLSFGSRVRIPELFGEKVFIVRDRMSPRFDDRVDIWMLEKADAIQFGVKYAKIEILEP